MDMVAVGVNKKIDDDFETLPERRLKVIEVTIA